MNWITEIEEMMHLKIDSYALLPGGLTNTNYMVTFSNLTKGVVRVPREDNRSLFDYPNEAHIINLIQPLKIDVPTLYFNTDSGIKLTCYIDNATTFHDVAAWTIPAVESLAHHLSQLHRLRPSHIRPFNLIEKLKNYQRGIQVPLHRFDTLKISEHITTLYQRYPLVLCHNDIVPGNILVSLSQLYLIDYEYAGMNIYLFDLASFLNENNLDYEHPLTIHFLQAYWQHPLHEADLDDLHLMDEIQCYLWHEWANRQFDITHEAIYREIANLKYQRYLNLCEQKKKG